MQGARPLFFLDYVATGKLEPDVDRAASSTGVARGCRENGCALLGGETAEMPGFYAPGEYDVAGTIVGVVDRAKIARRLAHRGRRRRARAAVGRACTPTATRSRARSSSRRWASRRRTVSTSSADARSATRCSRRTSRICAALEPLLEADLVHGMAHITGGGFYDNIPRVLPEGLDVVVKSGAWPVPPVFEVIEREGARLLRGDAPRLQHGDRHGRLRRAGGPRRASAEIWKDAGQRWFAIGNVEGAAAAAASSSSRRPPDVDGRPKRRLAVLLSGRGSNFEAIADAVAAGAIPNAEIVAVVSRRRRRAGPRAGARARPAGASPSTGGSSRPGARTRRRSSRSSTRRGPTSICLAGYMRLLSPEFVARWRGRILNIHPALLPKFPGLDAQRRALEAGETESGLHGPLRGRGHRHRARSSCSERCRPAGRYGGDASRRGSSSEEHRAYPEAIARVLATLARRRLKLHRILCSASVEKRPVSWAFPIFPKSLDRGLRRPYIPRSPQGFGSFQGSPSGASRPPRAASAAPISVDGAGRDSHRLEGPPQGGCSFESRAGGTARFRGAEGPGTRFLEN